MMKFLRRLGLAIGALTLSGGVLALGNYSLTQGSGTTFASVVVSSTHYAAYMLCDFVAGESQCAGVNSSGQIAIQAPPSLPLPTGAASAANQTNATQKTQVVDGSGNVIGSTSNALNVNCSAGCSGSAGQTVQGLGTAGTPTGGVLTIQGSTGMTAVTVTAGTINANVTNANANGQATMANSSPVVIASNQSTIPVGNPSTIATPLNVTLAPTVTYSALVKGVTAAITNTASTLAIAAVTSQRIYLTHISCNNTATATPTLINVQDGSGGTTIMTLIVPFGGGDTETGPTPLAWTTAGNGLYVAPVTTGTSTICNASGYSSVN
jgi:hypothetical protein